jgi:hypothetical protein
MQPGENEQATHGSRSSLKLQQILVTYQEVDMAVCALKMKDLCVKNHLTFIQQFTEYLDTIYIT